MEDLQALMVVVEPVLVTVYIVISRDSGNFAGFLFGMIVANTASFDFDSEALSSSPSLSSSFQSCQAPPHCAATWQHELRPLLGSLLV